MHADSVPKTPPRNNRLLAVVVLPLISCILTSIIGVLLGQIGNLFYVLTGEAGDVLALPAFCGLFLVTGGMSFLINKLLQKKGCQVG